MKEMIEGHLCNGPHIDERHRGRIKPWHSLLCSQCMGENAVEVVMSKHDMDEHNDRWKKLRDLKESVAQSSPV